MLVRAEAFAAAGLFAEDYFLYFEDLELCLRARRAGYRTVVVPGAVAAHEVAGSAGARSSRRLYFSCRNHLRLAGQAYPRPLLETVARACAIVALNVGHALLRAPAPRIQGLRAVVRGARDHALGRYGDRG